MEIIAMSSYIRAKLLLWHLGAVKVNFPSVGATSWAEVRLILGSSWANSTPFLARNSDNSLVRSGTRVICSSFSLGIFSSHLWKGVLWKILLSICSQISTPWPTFGPKCWAGGTFVTAMRAVLVPFCKDWLSCASLLCTAVPWQTGCRTSLHYSAKLCSSPLSQGPHFSHHTLFSDHKEQSSEVHLQAFSACSIYLGMCTASFFFFFFFRLLLLPTLLHRYRMEIKDTCLGAIKGICLKTAMSQIPTEYFRVLLWSPIHLSQSELPFLLSPNHWSASFLQVCFHSILQAWAYKI